MQTPFTFNKSDVTYVYIVNRVTFYAHIHLPLKGNAKGLKGVHLHSHCKPTPCPRGRSIFEVKDRPRRVHYPQKISRVAPLDVTTGG